MLVKHARAWTGVITLVAVLLLGEVVEAQMFGRRQFGRPLSRRPSPGLNQQDQREIGSLQGNERFLRQNRDPAAFVGPDMREVQRFIGMLQATMGGQTASSVQGVRRRVDRSATVNEPIAPAGRGEIYNPLVDVSVSTALSPVVPTVAQSNALETLVRSPQLSGSSRIAVSVADRVAILRGEVPSAADREMAAVLLSFEPGISSIRNELVVNPQLQTAADSLQALRDQQQPRQAWTTLSHGATEATRAPVWNTVSQRSY